MGRFLFQMSVVFLYCFDALSGTTQEHFTKFRRGGVLDSINILANHSVLSSSECGQYCLRYETCRGYNYKSAIKDEDDDINCQLSKQSDIKQNNVKYGDWVYYKAPLTSLSNRGDSIGGNSGRYRKGSCECNVKYEGELCQHERVFNSCAEILNILSDAKDGVYQIKTETTSNYTSVYCQMTSLAGCAGGGWTMVMKINGSKSTFEYNSSFWENKESFNIKAGQTGFDLNETKLPTFWSTSFKQVCIGMKVGNDLNFLSFSYPASSLYSLFADGKYRYTNITREGWKSLVAGSSLQTNCRKQGFNVDTSLFLDVRMGYIGNEQDHCDSTDSYIGIGSNLFNTTKGWIGWCNFHKSGIFNIAGNFAICSSDNGDVNTAVMAYLLVR